MRSLVVSELFGALPAAGVDCVRFDFRGVGASTGAFDHGVGERHDVRSRARPTRSARANGRPTYLVGWSFGADLALSIRDPGHAGWIGIALPLHWLDDAAATGADPRPKLLLLAEHDEYRPATEVQDATASGRTPGSRWSVARRTSSWAAPTGWSELVAEAIRAWT